MLNCGSNVRVLSFPTITMAKANTTSSAHTAGPWKIGKSFRGFHWPILSVNKEASEIEGSEQCDTVATVSMFTAEYRHEAYANASLIAAAPDLLLAAKEAALVIREIAREYMPESTVAQIYEESPAFRNLMNAIDKAEGRSKESTPSATTVKIDPVFMKYLDSMVRDGKTKEEILEKLFMPDGNFGLMVRNLVEEYISSATSHSSK